MTDVIVTEDGDTVIVVTASAPQILEVVGVGPQGPQGPKGDVGDVNPEMYTLRDEAAASASSASASATSATSSATSATASAASASTSASNAASSAASAASSASTASAEATNAANSASDASTSATSAAASASTATTQATDAALSAGIANEWATKTFAPVAGGEYSAKYHAQAAASSATAAAASYDSFDDRYLGPKPSDPTLDNDGNALLTGALYWNTAASEFRAYSGSVWVALTSGASNLDGLTDVVLSSVVSGNLLRHNGTNWVNYPDSNYAAAAHTHVIADTTGLQAALDAKLDDSQATTFGLSLLDDADAAAGRSTLGLGTLATQNGTFSGTSSGTNTGDQNIFQTISVSGQTNVVADSTTDTLTLAAGNDISITTDATTDTVTISVVDSPQFSTIELGNASDTTISRASPGVIAVEGGVVPKENRTNTFSANQIISVTDNTNAALRITQLGTGEAIRVEDETNPDATPFVVKADGNVGISTVSPDAMLSVNGIASFGDGAASTPSIANFGDLNTGMWFPADDTIAFSTGGAERLRLDGFGNFYAQSNSAFLPQFLLKNTANDVFGAYVLLEKYRGTSPATTNDTIGTISFRSADASNTAGYQACFIQGISNGAGTGFHSGYFQFVSYDASGNYGVRLVVNDNGLLTRDGTALLPSLSFSADPNTGFWRPAEDTIAASTGGSERLRINNSGRTLKVSATNASIEFNALSAGTFANQGIFFSVDGTSYSQIQNEGIGQLIFRTGSSLTERMRIASNGDVGIGTSSPQTLCHINGTIRYTNRPAAGTITAIGYDANGDLKNSSSSLRYKHDVRDYTKGLDTVMQLRPVAFKFNGETRQNSGFIAEEIDAAGLSEVMLYDEDGRPDGVLYANMVALLTKALQEANAKITALEARIAALENA